jgi:hypothetical protein
MKNFERLSFLYVATGNIEKLRKMLKIAAHRQDNMSRFHNALYLGDVEERIRVLKDVGLRTYTFFFFVDRILVLERDYCFLTAVPCIRTVGIPYRPQSRTHRRSRIGVGCCWTDTGRHPRLTPEWTVA